MCKHAAAERWVGGGGGGGGVVSAKWEAQTQLFNMVET